MQCKTSQIWPQSLNECHLHHVVTQQKEKKEEEDKEKEGKKEERKHKKRWRRKEGKRKIDGSRKGQWDCRGDCDRTSWISISKQNKYSSISSPPSLLLSHKPFQVPCRPFPHHDLYLLASSLLGSLSLSSPQLPPAAFFSSPLIFFLFAPFLLQLWHCTFSSRFLFSSHIYFFLQILTLYASVCCSAWFEYSLHVKKTRMKVGRRRWSSWPLSRSWEECGYFLGESASLVWMIHRRASRDCVYMRLFECLCL